MDPQKDFMSAVNNARPDQLDIQTTQKGDVKMNVVNAVNANGVISGRKVVDYIWQQVAICAMIIAAGCFVAVIVMIVIANAYNSNVIRLSTEKDALTGKLTELYSSLNVEGQGDALTTIAREETLDGSDIKQLSEMITKKYGKSVALDDTKESFNFAKKSKIYKIASIQVTTGTDKSRFLAYAKVSDGIWKESAYNEKDEKNPCKDMTDEDKKVMADIVTCPEKEEEKKK